MKGQGPKAVQSRIDSDYSWTPNPIEAALPLVANAGTYPAEAPAFRSGTGIRCHVLLVHPRRTDTAHHKLYLAEELDEGMTGTDRAKDSDGLNRSGPTNSLYLHAGPTRPGPPIGERNLQLPAGATAKARGSSLFPFGLFRFEWRNVYSDVAVEGRPSIRIESLIKPLSSHGSVRTHHANQGPLNR